MQFLGMDVDSRLATVSLTETRQRALIACLSQFSLGARVTWRMCLRLLGLMACSGGPDSTLGRPLYAPSTEVPPRPGAASTATAAGQGASHLQAAVGTPLVEVPRQSGPREQTRPSDTSPASVSGCVPRWLGSSARGCRNRGALERSVDVPAHQCPGAESSSTRSTGVPTSSARSPRAAEDRQCSGSCLHQQAGGPWFPSPLQTCSRPMGVGVSSPAVPQGNTSAWPGKSGSGLPVQRRSENSTRRWWRKSGAALENQSQICSHPESRLTAPCSPPWGGTVLPSAQTPWPRGGLEACCTLFPPSVSSLPSCREYGRRRFGWF